MPSDPNCTEASYGSLTPAQLEEIRERAERATRGPWDWCIHDYSAASIEGAAGMEDHVITVEPCEACQEHAKKRAAPEAAQWAWGRCTTPTKANAAFIAHARTDIPALLSHIASQAATIAALTEALDILDFEGGDDVGHNLDEAMKGVECGRRSRNLLERVRDQLARARAATTRG